MPIDTLDNLLAHELTDLLSAESQFAKALKQVAKAANSEQVKQMAEEHRQETLQHTENLKQAFSILGKKPQKGVMCKAAQGLVEESNTTLEEEKPAGVLKDLALLSGSLRIEHYEIAGYTSAIAVAKALGQRQVAQLLQQNLAQERATAKKVEAAASEFLKTAKSGAASGSAASGSVAKATKGGARKQAAKKQTAGKTAKGNLGIVAAGGGN